MPTQAGGGIIESVELSSPGAFNMATATVSDLVQSHDYESILLHGVRWSTYQALLEDLEGRRIRLTYDNGSLEIMTLSDRKSVV